MSMLRISIALLTAGVAFCTTAPAAAQIAPAKATLPSARTGCLPITVPYLSPTANAEETQRVGEEAAERFEKARTRWHALASAASAKRRGAVYVAIDLPPKDFSGAEAPGRVCAVLEGAKGVDGMTVEVQPSKQGYAGFCRETDPEACLASVFSALRFTEDTPWPRLPIYSLWRNDVPEPVDVKDVLDYLTLAAFDLSEPEASDGSTRSFDISDLSGCEGDQCAAAETAVETTDGRGIAWFLPLSEVETPKPAEDATNEGEGP